MSCAETTECKGPKALEAVSVFLVPHKFDPLSLRKCEEKSVTVNFGKGGKIKATVVPKVPPVSERGWGVLALEATLETDNGRLSLDDLLAFNVGFRRIQGELEPQDTFFGVAVDELCLSDGRSASKVYEELAHKILGKYEPPPELKKAVLLSYAKFERPLTDEEFYRFGSVAYPNEPVTPDWLGKVTESPHVGGAVFDRWKSAGARYFVYSYSLVCALDAYFAGREDERIKKRFLSDYVIEIGAAIAIQRAWLQEFPQRLRKAESLRELRYCHQELVHMQSRFGVRWTPEGTQRMTIEQMWRKATGVDDRMAEVQQLLEQKIDLYEAEATNRLNTTVLALQFIFGALAGGQIGVAFQPTWVGLTIGAACGILLCMPSLFTKLRGVR